MTPIETQTVTDNTSAPVVVGRCTACASGKLTNFFEAARLPVHAGVFYDSKELARQAPKGDITLAYCHNCGFVHNRRFDRAKIAYEPGYEVALHHSPMFRSFMEDVVTRLIQKYELRRKTVLEIGSGCAYFLRLLCERGENDCIGVDPTVGCEGVEQISNGRLRLIRDYFTEESASRFADLAIDLVCCLSVFEHIPQPAQLLKILRRMIGNRRTAVYFEVFNALRAFENHETWSIHYEQCNYFSKPSLAGMFRRCGFDVAETSMCYEGDQYLFVDAMSGAAPRPLTEAATNLQVELPVAFREFSDTHRQKIATWQDRLAEFNRLGKRVVVWGTGGKGISFLNTLDTEEVISYVVEINSDKQGKYVSGSGQLIVPPDFLVQYQPHFVIITNRLYEQEMKTKAEQLGVHCEFLIA